MTGPGSVGENPIEDYLDAVLSCAPGPWRGLPSSPIEPLVGAGLAGLSALAFAGITFNVVTVTHSQGVGQPVSLAVAAGCAAAPLSVAARRSAGRSFWARRVR